MPEYIEREAAHRMMVGLTRYMWTSPISAEKRVTVDADEVNFGLERIPAADVAPVVHGRWILKEDGDWSCSNCKNDVSICDCGKEKTRHKPYCPNCGAKMDGERATDA